ncbi:MAG TPA: amidohydrolase family protein [Longimicrobium sp.]
MKTVTRWAGLRLMAGALLALCTRGTLAAQQPAGDVPLVLRHVTVIDGTGAPPMADRSVLVVGGRIASIAPSSSAIPRGAHVLDLPGHFVIPGLIDAHVHLTNPFFSAAQQDSISALLFQGGVTAVRDMAGDALVLSRRAGAAESAAVPSPRIRFSAMMAGASFIEADPRLASIAHGLTPAQAPWIRSISGETDIRLAVEAARWTGATGLKLYADLGPELVAGITREAHRQGMKVWAHAEIFPAQAMDAVAAGVDALSHVHLLGLEPASPFPLTYAAAPKSLDFSSLPAAPGEITRLLDAMLAAGTAFEPTLYWTEKTGRRVEQDSARRHLWKMREWSYALIRRAHGMGIPIVAGTDLMGWPATDSLPYLHDELELLVTRAGLSPLQAIRSATSVNSGVLGMAGDYGTVEPGKVADLVVLRADPTVDIRNTRSVRYIVKAGRVHERSWPGGIGALATPAAAGR